MSATGVSAAPRRPLASRSRAGRDALWALLASRALVWAAGLLAFALIPLSSWRRADVTGLTARLGSVGEVLAAPAARWDAVHYVAIAEHGYEDRTQTAFFPLYPLVSRVVGTLTGGSVVAGGILVSLLAFGVALLWLHRLAEREMGGAAARRAVWLVALFPAALFFSAVYTEALFLALSVGAVLSARRGSWAWAGVLGAAAALTRNTGVLVLVPVLVLYLYGPRDDVPDPAPHGPGEPRWRPRHPLRADALWLALIPAGLALFMGYTWVFFGDPFATLAAQGAYAREFAGPFSALWFGGERLVDAVGALPGGEALRTLALTAIVVFALVGVAGALRRLPVAYGAYGLAALFVPLSTPWPAHPFWSTPRFVAVVFPVFMWLALVLGDRRRYAAVLVVFVLGLVYAAARFATWYWVA